MPDTPTTLPLLRARGLAFEDTNPLAAKAERILRERRKGRGLISKRRSESRKTQEKETEKQTKIVCQLMFACCSERKDAWHRSSVVLRV